jgi:ribonuclease P protein component
VLPTVNRMRRASEFSSVIRGGVRARRGSLIVYHLPELGEREPGKKPDTIAAARPPIVGLVVGRAVGPSVVRHRVSRRLRAQLTTRLQSLAPASGTVVRALPEAAVADSVKLGQDLDAALRRLGLAGLARTGGLT